MPYYLMIHNRSYGYLMVPSWWPLEKRAKSSISPICINLATELVDVFAKNSQVFFVSKIPIRISVS